MEHHVDIISKELIKPSSPTPDHLKTLKLSLLDTMQPPVYTPLVFFYETAEELTGLSPNTDHAQISHHLKTSLSEALTIFYPLAGKIDLENFRIDCDDTGAELIEARVHARLRDVVDNPNLDLFEKYLPADPSGGIYIGQGTICMAQINFFDCGGIGMAVLLSHIAGDGSSLVEFMNAWAAICRGENPKSAPQFGTFGHLFPHKDLSEINITPELLMGNDNLVSKRFVFDQEKIAALKQAGISESVNNPSKVEAVSAFILKHFQEIKKDEKNLLVMHAVNIRSRASPSLELEHAFGNGCFSATATLDSNGQTAEIRELVRRLRKAIRSVDEEYINDTQSKDRFFVDLGKICDMFTKGDHQVEDFHFSSWCRFPFYEVDFGWGRPLWVCTAAQRLNNFVIMMSTKSGDGIETWINMLPENFEALEKQFKLIGSTN